METIIKDKAQMNTLAACTTKLTQQGFDKQFKGVENGLMELSSKKIYSALQIKVLNFFRFEGESDPADNSILYAIETDDGTRGTLVDAYGPYSDTKVTEFMKKVKEIHKKIKQEEVL